MKTTKLAARLDSTHSDRDIIIHVHVVSSSPNVTLVRKRNEQTSELSNQLSRLLRIYKLDSIVNI